jgi:curli biogenesis system outer membrane secretion channel CsgG
MKKFLLYLLSLTLLSGCAHTVEVGKFKETVMDQKTADILPPQHVIDKKQPKVAVLPFGEPSEYRGRLKSGAQEGITQIVSKGCGMEVVERSQAQTLFDEKKFAGSLDVGADFSDLVQMAQGIDYVIIGSITNTSSRAAFTPSETTYNKKTGKSYTSKPYCTVSGQATMNIRVVNASTGSIAQAFQPFRGTVSNTFEVSGNSHCRVGDPISVVNQAVADAVKKSRKQFAEAFPRYGYLYKTMTGGDGRRIAYVNLGRLDGVKAGDEVELVRYAKEVDRVRKIERLTTQKIADVQIAETDLQDDRSIIIVPEEYSSQIMPGLAVKTKYNSNFFSELFQ